MSEYSTYDTETGEFIHVYDLENCLKSIRARNKDQEDMIKYLKEENRKLKEEHFKDTELQEMREKLDKMQKDYFRGFPITEAEQNAIKEWKKKHDEEVHGWTTDRMRMKAEGCCGGRYSYKFVPTSISTIGIIRCQCGAEFEFQEIG